MRDKNEDIHLYILEEERKRNRERVLREKILRERFLRGEVQELTGQPVRPSQDSFALFEGLCEKETKLSYDRNQSTIDGQESDFRVTERVAIVNRGKGPLKTRIFGLDRKGRNLKVGLIMSALMVACSVISIVALLRLDTVVHQDLYSYGLRFSLEWATPYWFAIRTALGMLCLMIFAAVLSQVYVLRSRDRGKGTDGHWETYALADGSTIRVKTVVKGVKRLREYGHHGKPVYSVEADNVVEVVKR